MNYAHNSVGLRGRREREGANISSLAPTDGNPDRYCVQEFAQIAEKNNG